MGIPRWDYNKYSWLKSRSWPDNFVKALDPLEFVPSKNNGPDAYKTALGCFKVGPIEISKMNKRLFKKLLILN